MEPSCKIVLASGKIEEGYCIVGTDLIFIEKDVYQLPNTNIYVDSLSRDLFLYPRLKIFVAVPKVIMDNEVIINGKKMYALYPLSVRETENYKQGLLTSKQIERSYKSEFQGGKGTYGYVRIYPTEQLAVKVSKKGLLSADMVKEISIYRFLGELACVPYLYGFNIDKEVELKLELGMDTLSNVIPVLKDDEKINIMFRLANCLNVIQSQGIFHLDLKPDNIIVNRSKQIRIIDWGLAEIDYSRNGRAKSIAKQTLWWKAPELLIAKPSLATYSGKADVFSLAVIFMQIWVGNSRWGGTVNIVKQKEMWLDKLLDFKGDFDANAIFDRQLKTVQSAEINRVLIRRYNLPPQFANLLSLMFEFNDTHRCTMDEVCNHPFFNGQKGKLKRPTSLYNTLPVIDVANLYKEIDISLEERKNVFENINRIGKSYKLSLLTTCSAYQLVDLYYYYTKQKRDIQQIGMACLSLCIKLYDFVVISEVNTSLEKDVITGLNGNLIHPSVYSYASRKGDTPQCYDLYLSFYLHPDCYRYMKTLYY